MESKPRPLELKELWTREDFMEMKSRLSEMSLDDFMEYIGDFYMFPGVYAQQFRHHQIEKMDTKKQLKTFIDQKWYSEEELDKKWQETQKEFAKGVKDTLKQFEIK